MEPIGKSPLSKGGKERADSGNYLPWDYTLYREFPVKIVRNEYFKIGPVFDSHWHEQIQLIYCEKGEAVCYIDSQPYYWQAGDIVIINGNEIHYGMARSEHVVYYLIKIDFPFLLSNQPDACQTKYIEAIQKGYIRFQNYVGRDEVLEQQISRVIREYQEQQRGWELVIKGALYQVVALLLRGYQQETLSDCELERHKKNLYQMREILAYMDRHYQENIRLEQLAGLANVSSQHFCRRFKNLTGRRPMDYINELRMNKAVELLAESSLNISEIALAVGFDDSNYFSRLFRKYKQISPSALRKG